MAQLDGVVPAAIGKALALLHAAPVVLDTITSPAGQLTALRRQVGELCARFPGDAAELRRVSIELERRTPFGYAAPAFLHGDLGPANLRWQDGRVVLLDFDDCTRGDPAQDLGNLLTQVRRLSLRKPHKVPDFPAVRRGLLDAYQRAAPPDPGLVQRVVWYERITLLRKIHFLVFDRTRHAAAEAVQRRQVEAAGLLRELPRVGESD